MLANISLNRNGVTQRTLQVTLTDPPAPSIQPAQFNRITYAYSSTYTIAQEASKYQIMAMQSNNASTAAALRAANPKLPICVYLTSLRLVTNGGVTGVPVPGNSAWYLLDQNGMPIVDSNGLYLVDPANTGFQQAFIAQAKKLAGTAFNGIFIDELNAHLGWTLAAGTTCPKYPTDATWQAAVYSFIQAVGPALRNAGLTVIGNIGGTGGYAGLWQQWNGPLSGALEEAWTDGGKGLAQQAPWWPKVLANIAWSEANGKYAMLHSHNTTDVGNVFGLASMLLVANGWSSYCVSTHDYSAYETWWPEYTTAQQLGAPLGAYTKNSSGLYTRQFANGAVAVNPTANAIGSIGAFSALIS